MESRLFEIYYNNKYINMESAKSEESAVKKAYEKYEDVYPLLRLYKAKEL